MKRRVNWRVKINTSRLPNFNDKGLLRRVDYITDVAGGLGRTISYDHLSFGGIVFPTLRRAVTRKESHSFLLIHWRAHTTERHLRHLTDHVGREHP